MIVLIEDANGQIIFDNVTHIEEKAKPSMFGDGTRKVINIYSGEQVLMGGDDLDLISTRVRILPNAEHDPNND